MLTDVIVVCTDGSDLSKKAVETAIGLAKVLGVSVVAMTSVTGRPTHVNGLEGQTAEVQERLNYVKGKAIEADVKCELVAEHCQAPYQGILAVAKRYDARFIVMASRGLGSFGSFFLGSETQKTLAEADRPVLVVR
ncbi:MAG: universal stress protein [Duodenibacillus sp.]|nr:universal stress protein [Duodenibacillus sp.]